MYERRAGGDVKIIPRYKYYASTNASIAFGQATRNGNARPGHI